jgi:predicted nucleic acid-binding protein
MTNSIVIDASAVLVWLLDEDRTAPQIKAILDRFHLVAPWLWRLEVANAILVRLRRKAMTETHANHVLKLLDEMPIEFVPEPEGRTPSELASVARPHQLSAYDAVYLDLAIRRNLLLFTRDRNLVAAAKRSGIKLVGE